MWHCIVGPDFGSYVTHERGCFCYFYLRRELSPVEKARCERKQRQEQLAISGAADEEDEQEDTIDSEVEERRMIGILLWRT